jgi:putative transposase
VSVADKIGEGERRYSVRELCKLFGVNRAWYYERRKLRAEREREETELKKAVEELLLEFAGYGYRRVTKSLQRAGFLINHKKVLRLFRKWGLLYRPFRKKKLATTVNDPTAPYAENLLKKGGACLDEVNRVWVSDVVMVVTKKERGYLASLLDRHSRRCVGWAVSAINDTALTLGVNVTNNRRPATGRGSDPSHGSRQQLHQLFVPGAVAGDRSANFP